MGSLTINDFPSDLVTIEYKLCGRQGCYRKMALFEKYGSDIVRLELLALITGDCDQSEALLGNRGCGAIYLALSKGQKNENLKFH